VSYLVGQTENGANKLTMYRYNEKSELSLSFIDTQENLQHLAQN